MPSSLSRKTTNRNLTTTMLQPSPAIKKPTPVARLTAAIIMPLLLAMLAALPASAQRPGEESYKFDFGAGLGMSGYLGDANRSNLFKHPGFAVNASLRYLFDSRWSLRGIFTTASLKGNTADWSNYVPEQRDFTAQIYDLGIRGEVNFFAFGIGETYKRLKRWTPYLSVGLGATLSSSGGKSFAALNIPMAFGIKYKVKPRFNLEATFTMTKTFSDHIDGDGLADLYLIKSSFLKNTDWYGTLTIGFTYEFGKRCVTCHRVD